jgi:uncharacterized protein (TIGR04442 family)
MHEDIRLHGFMGESIEYFAVTSGIDAHKRYFFNIDHKDDDQIRIFAPGSEIVLGPEGVSHQGIGGSFCEYMFGVDQPITDMAKGDVKNRLVMFGGHYDNESGTLRFSDMTSGFQSYEKIFFDGNAVCNYFFFLHSPGLAAPLKKQQEQLLRLLGKSVKRSAAISEQDDNTILAEIFPLLHDVSAQIYLIRLINRHHKEYSELFRSLYFRNKKIVDEDFARLSSLASRYGIDRYQQERIRIDVMYKHPDNKRIVDEYKKILISCNRRGEIDKLENARLTRLKTLSVRNKIPGALFYTLDEMLKRDKKLVAFEESDYISETRQILEGLFLTGSRIECIVDSEDMLKLLHAKKNAAENRDHTFEEILLETSKACDEKIRDGADISLLEGFSYIVTYFDRYDSAASLISQLAFMENVRITEDMIRSILGNKGEFDLLRQGLFEELFIAGVLDNKYVGNYGRKKVKALKEGLSLMEEKRMTTADLLSRLMEINSEEKLFVVTLKLVRERIRNFFSRYSTRADQESLRREVTLELRQLKQIEREIPTGLFNEVILAIKKEAIYIQNLLPVILAERNIFLREDFLENSGLDRFYVEELEMEYFALNDLNIDDLYEIRKGLN